MRWILIGLVEDGDPRHSTGHRSRNLRENQASDHRLSLRLLRGRLAVCRAEAGTPVPPWAWESAEGGFVTVTRTADELSIVCDEGCVPDGSEGGLTVEPGWRALRVAGPLDLAAVGVLASLVVPLARACVSVFSVSTFDTDYVLVRQADLGRAFEALQRAGHVLGIGEGC